MFSGSPTRQDRLHIVAANLHLAYSRGPLAKSDVFAALMRRLQKLEQNGPLPNVKQMCAGIRPDHEIEYIVVCPLCGQMFDCRDLLQVDHHSSEPHGPKLN
jgi:hypothetical protein